ncbi:uncharacterized protein LACBIDRAFT_335732 [Laccaria bicolor S238N-H82]|uniref:Predicted protein n=1 Tax=Laccaria bicolor (strain S238N-H82 / ATCC MYA-4686) TaxID=486041 RepID=B0E386_LACBS|nr:uncharacterized protein LACBIDRAFT_335732 [Laccaria bicolor S238N-H82]EDQ98690.1 predicted protein [Laccaria bicolor S238N-H82]|eukprot:XP_001890654.1 predicted protein [Laccaria bicolor S238N-H82]
MLIMIGGGFGCLIATVTAVVHRTIFNHPITSATTSWLRIVITMVAAFGCLIATAVVHRSIFNHPITSATTFWFGVVMLITIGAAFWCLVAAAVVHLTIFNHPITSATTFWFGTVMLIAIGTAILRYPQWPRWRKLLDIDIVQCL